MAKVNNILQGRVRSSSILEVTVALVIVSVAFGIFLMIYMNILAANLYLQKLKYEGRLMSQYQEILRTGAFIDDIKDEGQVRIFQTVTPYKGEGKAKQIELKAIRHDGKLLVQYKFIRYVYQQ
jgi:hypothetical protein